MPTWRDDLANLSPAEVRKRTRAMYRLEVDQPGVKWRMFQERCRREQKGLQALERHKSANKNKEKPSATVQKFMRRLQYVADKRVKERGGCTKSLLRSMFFHWDSRNSGMLTTDQLLGAMAQIGAPLTRSEAEEVAGYYAQRGGGVRTEIPHRILLEDATSGALGLLEVDSAMTARLLGTARSEGSLLGTSQPPRKMSAVVKAFRAKLIQVVAQRMRGAGGTQYSILRTIFLAWDMDQSGKTGAEELRGALRSLNMRISSPQAREVVRYFSKEGLPDGEFHYMDLVRDISGGDRGCLQLDQEGLDQCGKWDLDTKLGKSNCKGRAKSPGEGGREVSDRSVLAQDLHFTARPREKPANRAIEHFKLRLRDTLEKTIKRKGGLHHAIIREAFLKWDADASGELNPTELAGALNRMGVRTNSVEAKAIVNHYDLTGSGEMNYEVLCREIRAMSHPIISYIEDLDVLQGLSHTVREPPVVTEVLERIRAGVVATWQRAEKRTRSGGCPMAMSARDLLMGTCLRFDSNDTGAVDASALNKVWKELKIPVRQSETTALVGWLDKSGRDRVEHTDLSLAVFGNGHLSQKLSNDDISRSSSAGQLVARQKDDIHCTIGATKDKLPSLANQAPKVGPHPFKPRTAWNWQGRHSESPRYQRNTVEDEGVTAGGSFITRDPQRAGQTVKEGEGTVVAEKAEIERRLKELNQEKASLLSRRQRAGG